MEKKVRITREDYAHFFSYFLFKKRRRFLIVTVLFISLTINLTTLTYTEFNLFGLLKTFLLCLIPISILYPLLMYGVVYYSKYLPSDRGGTLGIKTFRITDEGLIEESEASNNIQFWSHILSVESNSNADYIFIDTMVAYIIPNRYFKYENEQQAFMNDIKERMNV